jgi:hypothetical protein
MVERSAGESVGLWVAATAVALVVAMAADSAVVRVGQWVDWMERQVADAMVVLLVDE